METLGLSRGFPPFLRVGSSNDWRAGWVEEHHDRWSKFFAAVRKADAVLPLTGSTAVAW
jgi:hypothetical protein